jgi:hypothetical protein
VTRSIDRGRFPGLVPGKRVCGPLRLPDVKPPCSNLAGTLVPAIFFSSRWLRGPVRVPACINSVGSQAQARCASAIAHSRIASTHWSIESISLGALLRLTIRWRRDRRLRSRARSPEISCGPLSGAASAIREPCICRRFASVRSRCRSTPAGLRGDLQAARGARLAQRPRIDSSHDGAAFNCRRLRRRASSARGRPLAVGARYAAGQRVASRDTRNSAIARARCLGSHRAHLHASRVLCKRMRCSGKIGGSGRKLGPILLQTAPKFGNRP